MRSLLVYFFLVLLSILATTLHCRFTAAPWAVLNGGSHEHELNTSAVLNGGSHEHEVNTSVVTRTEDVKQHQMPQLLSDKESCSGDDVVLYQSKLPSLPSGIPAYSVEIINSCIGCTVYNVHVSCRDFASTDLVNPVLFRRLSLDDCLVKDGGSMGPGEVVSFQYSNSFAYPLDISYVACGP